jgi:hypothetical protein
MVDDRQADGRVGRLKSAETALNPGRLWVLYQPVGRFHRNSNSDSEMGVVRHRLLVYVACDRSGGCTVRRQVVDAVTGCRQAIRRTTLPLLRSHWLTSAHINGYLAMRKKPAIFTSLERRVGDLRGFSVRSRYVHCSVDRSSTLGHAVHARARFEWPGASEASVGLYQTRRQITCFGAGSRKRGRCIPRSFS